MLIEYALYSVPAHKKAEFIGSFQNVSEILKRSNHCYSFSLRQSSTEVINFILEITWESLEGHVNGFKRSNDYLQFLEIVLPYQQFIKDIDFYAPLPYSWERSTVLLDLSTMHVN